VSSRGKNQTSHLGLVELHEGLGLGLGLVSDQNPNVSVASRSRKLWSCLHPCVTVGNTWPHLQYIRSTVMQPNNGEFNS